MPIRLLTLLLFPVLLLAQRSAWDEPFPAHRVADNLYHVGSKGLATYLITTPEGHILINSSFERAFPIIKGNIEQLGFKLSDVKILLGSHAHGDHMQGNALVQKATGAQVYVMQGDDQIIAGGNGGRWQTCKVDRVLKDGDKVMLDGVTLTAHLTPGHTKGCTTWMMQAVDGGKTHNVMIIGSPNVNAGYHLVNNAEYPEIATDYALGFKVLKSLPCEVFLGAHGDYYGLVAKHPRMKDGVNPFIDPQGCRAYIEEREQAYLKTLAEQRQGK
jgi:metallo-beta-lactamase class B